MLIAESGNWQYLTEGEREREREREREAAHLIAVLVVTICTSDGRCAQRERVKLSQHDLTITCKLHAATRRHPTRKASKLSEAKLSFICRCLLHGDKQSKHRALHGGAMPLLDHAGSFTLSLGHSTHTIPPGSGRVHPPCTELAYGPPWRGSSTHHMAATPP